MLMSHLHATFRSLADAELPLDKMVGVANRIFAESTMAGQFATLVVGRATHDGAVEIRQRRSSAALASLRGRNEIARRDRRPAWHVSEHKFPRLQLF